MKISVVVPTCGRPRQLTQCLQAIQGADEIVVTSDDASVPPSTSFGSYRIRLVKGPGHGPAANRNSGARAATGDWLGVPSRAAVISETMLPRIIVTWLLLPVWTVYLLCWEWKFRNQYF
jgi:hypothetical protein